MHLLAYLSLLPLAACWGELGHRTIAYLAHHHLTPQTQTWLNQTLNGEDISTAAVWPDEIKNKTKYGSRYAYASPWHFYNVPGSFAQNCTLNATDVPAACSRAGCAIEAIANHTRRVQNHSLTPTDRAEAMKFVLHLIGDIHQPLHTEAIEQGGNNICVRWGRSKQTPYPGYCANLGFDNLHSVWDDLMLQKLVQEKYNISLSLTENNTIAAAALKWSEHLYSAKDSPNICPYTDSRKCAFTWAQESNKLVCSNVLADGIPGNDTDLSKGYYEENKGVVEERVKIAGLRLAAWIDRMATASAAAVLEEKEEVEDGSSALYVQPELRL